MKIKLIIDENDNKIDCNAYITFKKGFKYINTILDGPGICPICLEYHQNRKAHHIIPLRLHTKNDHLKELRIRICTKCHEKMHPENDFIVACQKMMGIVKNVTDGEEDKIEGIKEIKALLKANNCGTIYHEKAEPWHGVYCDEYLETLVMTKGEALKFMEEIKECPLNKTHKVKKTRFKVLGH